METMSEPVHFINFLATVTSLWFYYQHNSSSLIVNLIHLQKHMLIEQLNERERVH